jgi:1,2-diacylglycerol 3-alpha-glucosyltransferase
MRILIAGTTYFPATNGQAIFTTNLAERLVRAGHEVLAVFPSEGRSYRIVRNGVRLEAVQSISLNWIHPQAQFSPFPEPTVRRVIETFRPQVVHIQDHYPISWDAIRIAQRRGIKVVGSNHFMPENLSPYLPAPASVRPLVNWMLWQWMLEAYNRVNVVTAQSQAAASLVQNQGLRVPVYPVSCGIDLERFYPDPAVDRNLYRQRYGLDLQRKLFLFVGRIDAEKRIDVLLRALRRVQRDDVQLVIAGRGAASQELQALAQALDLGERVRFTGFIPVEDLPALLNSVDVFCMPSEAELLSIATLEAMACGRPVLLADAIALPELVTNGLNGYLFRPGDPQDAAWRMVQLASQSERWAEMGQASLKRARQHSLDHIVQKYETLYDALSNNAPLPADLSLPVLAASARRPYSVKDAASKHPSRSISP